MDLPPELDNKNKDKNSEETYLGRFVHELTDIIVPTVQPIADLFYKSNKDDKDKKDEKAEKLQTGTNQKSFRQEAEHYAVEIIKSIPLFLPRLGSLVGKESRAIYKTLADTAPYTLTAATYGLDQAKIGDTLANQISDFSLGMTKGALTRGIFEFADPARLRGTAFVQNSSLANSEIFNIIEKPVLKQALHGWAMGVPSRIVDLSLTRQTYLDSNGNFSGDSFQNGLSKIWQISTSPAMLATDAITFVGSWGLLKGANFASSGIIDKSITAKSVATGASFGLVSGSSAEVQRQIEANEKLDIWQIAGRGLLQAGSMSISAYPGGRLSAKIHDKHVLDASKGAGIRLDSSSSTKTGAGAESGSVRNEGEAQFLINDTGSGATKRQPIDSLTEPQAIRSDSIFSGLGDMFRTRFESWKITDRRQIILSEASPEIFKRESAIGAQNYKLFFPPPDLAKNIAKNFGEGAQYFESASGGPLAIIPGDKIIWFDKVSNYLSGTDNAPRQAPSKMPLSREEFVVPDIARGDQIISVRPSDYTIAGYWSPKNNRLITYELERVGEENAANLTDGKHRLLFRQASLRSEGYVEFRDGKTKPKQDPLKTEYVDESDSFVNYASRALEQYALKDRPFETDEISAKRLLESPDGQLYESTKMSMRTQKEKMPKLPESFTEAEYKLDYLYDRDVPVRVYRILSEAQAKNVSEAKLARESARELLEQTDKLADNYLAIEQNYLSAKSEYETKVKELWDKVSTVVVPEDYAQILDAVRETRRIATLDPNEQSKHKQDLESIVRAQVALINSMYGKRFLPEQYGFHLDRLPNSSLVHQVILYENYNPEYFKLSDHPLADAFIGRTLMRIYNKAGNFNSELGFNIAHEAGHIYESPHMGQVHELAGRLESFRGRKYAEKDSHENFTINLAETFHYPDAGVLTTAFEQAPLSTIIAARVLKLNLEAAPPDRRSADYDILLERAKLAEHADVLYLANESVKKILQSGKVEDSVNLFSLVERLHSDKSTRDLAYKFMPVDLLFESIKAEFGSRQASVNKANFIELSEQDLTGNASLLLKLKLAERLYAKEFMAMHGSLLADRLVERFKDLINQTEAEKQAVILAEIFEKYSDKKILEQIFEGRNILSKIAGAETSVRQSDPSSGEIPLATRALTVLKSIARGAAYHENSSGINQKWLRDLITSGGVNRDYALRLSFATDGNNLFEIGKILAANDKIEISKPTQDEFLRQLNWELETAKNNGVENADILRLVPLSMILHDARFPNDTASQEIIKRYISRTDKLFWDYQKAVIEHLDSPSLETQNKIISQLESFLPYADYTSAKGLFAGLNIEAQLAKIVTSNDNFARRAFDLIQSFYPGDKNKNLSDHLQHRSQAKTDEVLRGVLSQDPRSILESVKQADIFNSQNLLHHHQVIENVIRQLEQAIDVRRLALEPNLRELARTKLLAAEHILEIAQSEPKLYESTKARLKEIDRQLGEIGKEKLFEEIAQSDSALATQAIINLFDMPKMPSFNRAVNIISAMIESGHNIHPRVLYALESQARSNNIVANNADQNLLNVNRIVLARKLLNTSNRQDPYISDAIRNLESSLASVEAQSSLVKIVKGNMLLAREALPYLLMTPESSHFQATYAELKQLQASGALDNSARITALNVLSRVLESHGTKNTLLLEGEVSLLNDITQTANKFKEELNANDRANFEFHNAIRYFSKAAGQVAAKIKELYFHQLETNSK